MKRAFLLMEVIVSVILIFTVILALFQIKENNFNILQKMSNNDIFNSALSLVALNHQEKTDENNRIFLKDVVNTDDESLRKTFKNFKVNVKDKELNTQMVLFLNFAQEVTLLERTLELDKQLHKNIYTIKFD